MYPKIGFAVSVRGVSPVSPQNILRFSERACARFDFANRT
jgi:hypothetical protein